MVLYQHQEAATGDEYTIPLNEIQEIKWRRRRADAKAPWKAIIFWKNGSQERYIFFTEAQKAQFLQAYGEYLEGGNARCS